MWNLKLQLSFRHDPSSSQFCKAKLFYCTFARTVNSLFNRPQQTDFESSIRSSRFWVTQRKLLRWILSVEHRLTNTIMNDVFLFNYKNINVWNRKSVVEIEIKTGKGGFVFSAQFRVCRINIISRITNISVVSIHLVSNSVNVCHIGDTHKVISIWKWIKVGQSRLHLKKHNPTR